MSRAPARSVEDGFDEGVTIEPWCVSRKHGHRPVNAPPPARPASAAVQGLVSLVLCRVRAATEAGEALTAMVRAQRQRRPASVGGLTPAFDSNCTNFNFS